MFSQHYKIGINHDLFAFLTSLLPTKTSSQIKDQYWIWFSHPCSFEKFARRQFFFLLLFGPFGQNNNEGSCMQMISSHVWHWHMICKEATRPSLNYSGTRYSK